MNNVVVVNVKLINVSFTPQKCIIIIKSSYKGIPEITWKEFGSTIVRVVSLGLFFDYLVYGSADPIFQDFEERKKIIFFEFFFFFFFIQIFSYQSQSRIKEEGK